MNHRLRILSLALLLGLPSCMATNLAAWADTRLDSPAEEYMRQGVATLFIIPAVVGDVVFFPVQLLGGYYPYGDWLEPDPEPVRYRLNKPDPRGDSARR